MSTAVTVKLCHSTVNNRSNRQTLCAPSTVNNMHVASEATVKWNQRERERKRKKCLLQVYLPPCWLVLVKTAGRASGPGRQDCGRRDAPLRPPSSLSCDGRLIVGGVAELSSVGNCSPTCVFGTSLLGSAFIDLAVIVSWLSTSGILSVDSPGPVILWSSSFCWRCSALLLWRGALG